AEPIDRPGGRPVDGEVGEDLADHRGELEAMPGAGGGERDARRSGMAVDDELLVRGVRVQADVRRPDRAVGTAEMFRDERPDPGLVRGAEGAIDAVRPDEDALVVACHL